MLEYIAIADGKPDTAGQDQQTWVEHLTLL
jgi:hypothetical protein